MRLTRTIEPMLAVSGEPFSAKGWIFEPKIDGTRCISHISAKGVWLQNRRGRPISHRYPEIVEALSRSAPAGAVLDGEIAVLVDGRPDFRALSQREHQSQELKIDLLSKALPASYIAFDILFFDGVSVMDQPLQIRKGFLKEALEEGELVVQADHMHEHGEAYFRSAVSLGLEGVVSKRLSSPYQPGVRSPDWVKIKRHLYADLVVGGYIPGSGSREGTFGGLLLGAYDQEGSLAYLGRVGSGFTDEDLVEISGRLSPVDESPFGQPPDAPGVRWVEPDQVLEVRAMELTANGHLRAPVFVRLREDKAPEDCELGQLG